MMPSLHWIGNGTFQKTDPKTMLCNLIADGPVLSN